MQLFADHRQVDVHPYCMTECLYYPIDAQLSSVDFSIKMRPYYSKDTSVSTNQVSRLAVEEGKEYPTQITDARNVPATDLNRKVSRSFKTAKRNTILGNVDTTQKVSTTIPEDAVSHTRPVPTRQDSLNRPIDQHKVLPPLPQDDDNRPQQQDHSKNKGIRLDDVPQFAKTVTERPSSTAPPSSMMTAHININSATGKPRVYLSELSALQDMIIRHVAVVQIEAYVRDYFTPSELLHLIENKKASIWEKLFSSIMHGNKKTNKGKEVGTFGVSLDILTERTGVESNLGASASPVRVAAFIDDSVTAMRQMGNYVKYKKIIKFIHIESFYRHVSGRHLSQEWQYSTTKRCQ